MVRGFRPVHADGRRAKYSYTELTPIPYGVATGLVPKARVVVGLCIPELLVVSVSILRIVGQVIVPGLNLGRTIAALLDRFGRHPGISLIRDDHFRM